MEIKHKCIGCGVAIQTEHKNQLGYAPESALQRETIVCQRCFRLKHYNEVQDVPLTEDDFLKILSSLGERRALIVKIVDIFDFNGSWLPSLQRFVGNNDILLVGNKVDLLPKAVKKSRLIHWLKHEASQLGLKPVDVFVMSATKSNHLEEVAKAIEHYRRGQDVYIVGCTNVGKSTFINQLIKQFSGEENVITTSHFPGTTLSTIEIPLEDGKALIDTPGIINSHQMAHYVDERDLKVITPEREIKPKVYQLNEGQTLYFGGLARFDYILGGRRAFTCYFANNLPIHRTRVDKADELYKNHVGKMLSPPRKEQLETFPKLVRQEFAIKKEKTDLVFSGLGWITINEPGATVVTFVPQGVHTFIRKSLI